MTSTPERRALVGLWCCCMLVLACDPPRAAQVPLVTVPGVYVLEDKASRDEVELRADGTFHRKARYGGTERQQAGKWLARQESDELGRAITILAFFEMEPRCIEDTRSVPGPSIRSDDDLCPHNKQMTSGAVVCKDLWAQSICFEERETFRFRRR